MLRAAIVEYAGVSAPTYLHEELAALTPSVLVACLQYDGSNQALLQVPSHPGTNPVSLLSYVICYCNVICSASIWLFFWHWLITDGNRPSTIWYFLLLCCIWLWHGTRGNVLPCLIKYVVCDWLNWFSSLVLVTSPLTFCQFLLLSYPYGWEEPFSYYLTRLNMFL